MTSFDPLDANDVGRADAHEPTVAQLAQLPHDEATDILRERAHEQELRAEQRQEDGDGTYLGDRLIHATQHLHDAPAPAEEPGLLDQIEQFGHEAWQKAEDTYSQAEHYLEEHADQLVDEVQPDQ